MRELLSRDASGPIDCSVLIPVLNEERHIAAAISAMRRQRFSGNLEFLVADGGSTDRTGEILAELARLDPRIRILENARGGTPSGLNVALAHARGRWVVRMDAHTEYPEDYIALGVARLAHGDTRWVSGPPIPAGDGRVSRAVALALSTPLGRGGSRKWAAEPRTTAPEYELDAGVFGGVWDRSTVLEYGGWDERWLRNQDSEMAGRFHARGERLVCVPGMAAHYRPRDSLRSLWKQYFEYGMFREQTAVRHPQTMRRSHLPAPALSVSVLAAVASPKPLRRIARVGVALYLVVLAHAGVEAARRTDRPGDAAMVPVVLAAMHTAHGAGAWVGAIRHGPPLAGIARALGLRRLARLAPARSTVYAPSLDEAAGGRLALLPLPSPGVEPWPGAAAELDMPRTRRQAS
jgi:succinoglycan biosynthesis protein ExoA